MSQRPGPTQPAHEGEEPDSNGAPGAASIAPAPTDGIVVGQDGSMHAAHALEVALDLAERFRVPLTIVRAWSIDTAPNGSVFNDGYVASLSEISAAVRQQLERDTKRTVAHRQVAIDYRAALGEPAEVLIAISANSRMLVVGTRGHGSLVNLLLGSVSEQCVHNALCPVLVVPGSERRTAAASKH